MHSVELRYFHTVDEKVHLNVSSVRFELTGGPIDYSGLFQTILKPKGRYHCLSFYPSFSLVFYYQWSLLDAYSISSSLRFFFLF